MTHSGAIPATRPLAYDMTHLVTRITSDAPTGIDRVDVEFARHFVNSGRLTCGVHYGRALPHAYSPALAGAVVREVENHFVHATRLEQDPVFERIAHWLRTGEDRGGPSAASRSRMRRIWKQSSFRVRNQKAFYPPRNAIYLNVAQHACEYPRFFAWLDDRPDLRKIFMLHDLLPRDWPEYFDPDNIERFDRRLDTIVRHADALIVTTQSVRRRVEQHYESIGRQTPAICVAAPPSPLDRTALTAPVDVGDPYFVTVGTIEPRKNHLLLLHMWRELAREDGAVPKLVVIGQRGWENEQVIDLLERCELIRPHVIEAKELSADGLRALVSGARALLAPSFAEGYGIPVVEALSLGTPVIASNTEVFREVTQSVADLVNPLDGPGWRAAVIDLLSDDRWYATRARVAGFDAPTRRSFFSTVEAFFDGL